MKSPFAGSGLAISAGVKHVVGIQYVSSVRDNVVMTYRMISSGGGEKGSQEKGSQENGAHTYVYIHVYTA